MHVIEAYAQSLRLRGDLNGAIETLGGTDVHKVSHHGQLMLGMLLMERGKATDVREAAELFRELAKQADLPREDYRENVIEMALEALAKDNRLDAGETLLQEIPENTISTIAVHTFKTKLNLLAGKPDLAAAAADDALKQISETTSVHDLRRLAGILWDMGRHKDALALWQSIAVPGVLSMDTRRLLECASRLGRDDVMLEVFQNLRSAGVVDRKLLEHEISLLETYDTESAINVLKEEIARDSSDKKLKLRLSVLGLALNRPDLVEKDPLSVPSIEEVTPKLGIRVVQVLRAIEYPMDGVRYAYELLRRNFSDVDAHRAMFAALAPFESEPEIKKPEVAEVGSAVCYVEHGDTTPRWLIIEDSEDPDPKLDEFPPNHPLCEQVLGKKIGDTFRLAKGVQDRTAEIKSILSKYVYRFQDCTSQWQVRFPSTSDIQMVRVIGKKDQTGKEELDISALEKFAEKRFESVKKTQELYQTQPIPLHLVGAHFGTNTFAALRHLASQLDVQIRCCFGSAEERQEAAKALRSSNTVVLEMSAVASLFSLERLDVLENWPTDLVVSQSTVNELRQMISNEVRMYPQQVGVFVKTEAGFGIVEQTAEQRKPYIKELEKLVHLLEKKCKVLSCRALASVEPKNRKSLIQSFGIYGAEAIVLASVPGAVLWTDDHIQALLARKEHGVLRVWTQLVIGEQVNSGAIDAEAYFDASAKMVGFRYFFTSVNPQILRRAANLAEWKVSFPFSQALAVLEDESIDLFIAIQLAAGFLQLLYRETLLPETQDSLTVRVLEHLAKRTNGIRGIQGLRRVLPRSFGLNVVGLASAAATIDAWLKSK